MAARKGWECQCRSCAGSCENEVAYKGWFQCRPCTVGWHSSEACPDWNPQQSWLYQNSETPLCETCGLGRLKHKGEKR